jgi:hypothetical protein
MLEAVPKGIFSNTFVLRSSGEALGELNVSFWRERAEFQLDGIRHRLYREALMSGAFVLERAGCVVARAIKPSVFLNRFEIDLGGRPFTLRKISMFSRRFGLFFGEQQVGAIGRASWFTRRAVLELPPDWSPAFQLFVFWLALLIWKRNERAAAS